ncbi:HWE histidine kinase domain-containing protein [Aurantimonas sp. Leaf443]|uniref:HWE histidine kinase domain-containing protein n=1 Tax=Aurantimonas sp. Leaf443 TaxID=1736378 RepID=UPI0006F3F6E8|nr:HWE histidine kinase domain-containing protein [Aurantimonas sp. Leaf443]KQT87920.1 two-component system sensor histidine kinase/response regulator [Aurantimonas sp. Leaf443]
MNLATDPKDLPVDLSNCDREPIHLLGRIQNVGFLIAVSMDWMVQHVSANAGERFGRPSSDLPGEPLTSLLSERAIHAIRGRLQVLSNLEGSERIFDFDLFDTGERFDIAVHVSGDTVVIEAEPAPSVPATNPAALVKSVMMRVQKTETLAKLYRECVRQLRAITGFDRVMLYRFAEDGSGNVIAESVRSGIDSFHGLNYPATDIPAQARALYVRNQIRSIADVEMPSIPIEPQYDAHGRPLDLSMSVLRSVSPIHVEYLRNMGVRASLSISIVIDGKLWGLFALHHYAPRHLPMELRSAAELFAQMISLVIEGRLFKERRQSEAETRVKHDRFIAKIVSSTGSIESIVDFAEDLRDLVACDGLAIYTRGRARTFGRCPTADELPGLARFLNRAASSKVFSTCELGAVHPPAQDYRDRAAGLLAIPISRSPRDYILFFRREIARTVTWAGNPSEAKELVPGPNGLRLTPRRSFEAWKETVYGQAEAWTESDLRAAEALRISILEVLLRFNEESERQQTLAAQRQELLIAELNHRVRNILSLIRALVTQSRAGARSIDDFSDIIAGRIQALARAHDQITNENFSSQPLDAIIQTEVQAYLGQKADRVLLDGPDVFVEAAAFSTLALVFHEMVTNSAKYGGLSDTRGSVHVTWRIDEDECCVIDWREEGGPPVAPPTRRGFGSTIIERSIPHDLGGEARLDFKLSGLTARFVLPPSSFTLVGQASPRAGAAETDPDAPAPAAGETPLAGLSALLVEDNLIISIDAEELLREKGVAKVFAATSVSDANGIIGRESLDVAILDVNLGAETSFPLTETLNAAGVPFVFVTGYGERIDFPPEAGAAEAVKKPFATGELIAALQRALARRGGAGGAA